MATETLRINYNCPVGLIQKLDEEADKLNITRSACLNMILSQYFRSVEMVQNMPRIMSTMNAVVAESRRINKD